MKKILCGFFAVLMLLSCLAFSASAAVIDNSSVMTELQGLSVDGKPFSVLDYEKKTEFELITVVEKNYYNAQKSDGYALYFYFFNPSGKKITESKYDSIEISLNSECTNYKPYAFRVMSQSSDGRFVKVGIVDSSYFGTKLAYCYQKQESDVVRSYNVRNIKIGYNTYEIKRAYYFKGYEWAKTLTAASEVIDALDVTLTPASWVSPNAGTRMDGTKASEFDHYEVASVYFTIPKSYLKTDQGGFEYIKSIRADFERFKLEPIIVTRPGLLNSATKDAITKSLIVNQNTSRDVDVLRVTERFPYKIANDPLTHAPVPLYRSEWVWSEDSNSTKTVLSYYFEDDDLPEDFDFDYGQYSKISVTADELRAYFRERLGNSKYNQSGLYSELVKMEEDYNSVEYGVNAVYDLSTFTQDMTAFEKWFAKAFKYKDDSGLFQNFATEVQKIQVFKDPSAYVGLTYDQQIKLADELYISTADIGGFVTRCAEAAQNDEAVVLLRVGVTDYTCRTLYGEKTYDKLGFAVDKYYYKDVGVTRIVFSRDKLDYVVPVASNRVDIAGNVEVFEDIKDKNGIFPDDPDAGKKWWDGIVAALKELGEKVLKVLIVVGGILLFVLVIWLGKTVFGILSAGGKLVDLFKRKRKKDKPDPNKRE